MKIGWIGLGQMGEPMALRALRNGHEVIAHTRSATRKSQLAAEGGTLSTSITEIAANTDILILCLFDDLQLQDVLIEQSALSARPNSSPVVIHTTGDPIFLEKISATESGGNILDAPFSGTASMAAEGNITLLAGGEVETLDAARPVVESYCSNIIHLGKVGAARRVKLLNNLLFAAQTNLATEILQAAQEMGMSIASVAQAINQCSGASYAMGKFSETRSVDSILRAMKPYLDKDVSIARAAMERENIRLPITYKTAERGKY